MPLELPAQKVPDQILVQSATILQSGNRFVNTWAREIRQVPLSMRMPFGRNPAALPPVESLNALGIPAQHIVGIDQERAIVGESAGIVRINSDQRAGPSCRPWSGDRYAEPLTC